MGSRSEMWFNTEYSCGSLKWDFFLSHNKWSAYIFIHSFMRFLIEFFQIDWTWKTPHVIILKSEDLLISKKWQTCPNLALPKLLELMNWPLWVYVNTFCCVKEYILKVCWVIHHEELRYLKKMVKLRVTSWNVIVKKLHCKLTKQ